MLKETEIGSQIENDDKFWEEIYFENAKRKAKGKLKYPNTEEFNSLNNLLKNIVIKNPTKNDVVEGSYIGIVDGFHCFTVVGYKDDVRIENRPLENKYLKNISIGDKIDFMIKDINEEEYLIEGSIAGIYESKLREKIMSISDDLVVIANIKSLNPAGYDIDILHDGVTLPGFMPNTLAGINKLYDPNSIVGQEIEVMIESFSSAEGTYIVSRRKYLRTLIPDAIDSLELNTIYTGMVTGTTLFGVFVEFEECLTGMIHKANLQTEWQERISEIKPGYEIEFYVKEVIKDKIILTQIIRESLWDIIKIGQTMDAKVKDNKKFGTLVSLDHETMGLIHNSELEKLGRSLQADQEIKVKVLAVDRQSRKIFLTLVN